MVPKGWTDGRVEDLLNGLESGVSVNGEDRQLLNGEKGVLKVSAVTYGTFDPTAVKVIQRQDELNRAKINPRKSQIIISRSNTESLVGASAYINSDYPELFLPDKLWQTIPKPDANMKWLSYVLSSEPVRYTLSNLATGTSGSMKNITKGEFLSLRIAIPPLPEQQKIAKILSTWDQAISTTDHLIENSTQQKRALMQQLLTGKKRLLDESGKRFEGEWIKTDLRKLLKEEGARNKGDKIQRVLSVTNHSGFVLPEEHFSKRVASKDTSNYKIVRKGQFGYNPSRINVGSFARLDEYEEGVLSPMYVIFSVLPKKLNSDYFYQWMHSHEAKQRINNSTQGSVRDSVNFSSLEAISLSIPNLEEQKKIATVLTNADKEIELLEQQLADLQQEKKALMQVLLTGKKRVVVDGEKT